MVASGTFESSSGVVLDVLTEASNAETVFINHMDRNCQVLLPDVLCMGKMSFSYVQKCIKNKVGVCPCGRKE